jgi:hypothetical protein
MRTMRKFVWAAIPAMLASAPASVRAQELTDYVVESGDSCTSVAKKVYGDEKRYDLIHGANPQLGAPPHHLKAGQILKLPKIATGPQAPDAKVTFVRNQVEAYTPAEHPAKRNEDLQRGHRVSTLGSSSAEVMFASEAILQLGEHTLVVILGTTKGQVSKTEADTTLVQGSLRARLGELAGRPAAPAGAPAAPPPKAVTISTPAGHRIELGGGGHARTESKVTVDAAQATRVAVYQGTSTVRAMNQDVVVPQGFGSKAEKSTPPSPPRPLPPAPTWTSAPPRVVLTNSDLASVDGAFAPGTGVGPAPQKWHLEMARDLDFNDLVFDATVPVDVTRLEARGLTPGGYHARVSAIDADAFEGPPSIIAHVEVAAPKVGGAEQHGALEVPAGLFCGIDGGALAATTGPLTFRRGPAHELRCAAGADGAGLATWKIPAQSLGAIALTTGATAVDGSAIRLTFSLRDGAGEPIEDGDVAARVGDHEATVAKGSEPGQWIASTVGQSGRQPLDVTVNGVDHASADVETGAARRRVRVAAGVFAGAGVSTAELGAAPLVGVEIGALYTLSPHWQIGAAGRFSYERYRPKTSSYACGGAPSPTLPGCLGNYDVDVADDLFTLGLPLTVRWAPARWSPYLSVMPAAVFERGETRLRTSAPEIVVVNNPRRFAFQGLVGVEHATIANGGLFIEGGYRTSDASHRNGGDFTLGAVLVDFGFRVGF